MKSKYTYEIQWLQRPESGESTAKWQKDHYDGAFVGMLKKIIEAKRLSTLWGCWRVVRKQGRKIVKVIYQTK